MNSELIPAAIFFIRGQKVMLSTDLASLYGVLPKVLMQAVRRNIERFPGDFMFQLTQQEIDILRPRSQIVTLKKGKNIKYLPYAFTEQGVAMLSTVLRSKRAVSVNIEIMRTFVKLRKLLGTSAQLALKIEQMEKKYDKKFKVVFDALRALMTEEEKPKTTIGFHTKK
ncbi:ORF6N domain-containing protein [Candidatus Parcubacteria bacterium]|nr:ORF6N domain-containing protein [Candidatus Parcubacteria bacterium]